MQEVLNSCPVCSGTDLTLFMTVRDHFLTGEKFDIQECKTCRFRFVNPRPAREEIGKYYQSAEYRSHDARRGDLLSRIYRTARAYSLRRKYRIVNRCSGSGKILDFGCGTGEFLNFCRKKGYEVTGVEPNPGARTFAQNTHNLTVYQDLDEISAIEGAFCCITMWHVLEHVHDLDGTLSAVRKLLKPDGTFIVAVPNCDAWDAGKYGGFWAAYDVPRHLSHFTAASMREVMMKHGFEEVALLPQRLDSFYISLLSGKYKNGKTNYLVALAHGFWSNLMAHRKNRGYSSRIFVLTPKNVNFKPPVERGGQSGKHPSGR